MTIIWEPGGGAPRFSQPGGDLCSPSQFWTRSSQGTWGREVPHSRTHSQHREGVSFLIPKLICFSARPAEEVRSVPIVPNCQDP